MQGDFPTTIEACQRRSFLRAQELCAPRPERVVMVDVYACAERMVRERLAHRRSDFVERCVVLALWILRTHGPHGFRQFPVDRRALLAARSFQGADGRPRLTENQIRNALKALKEIELVVLAEESRWRNPFRRYADVFVIGMEFATLFPECRAEGAPSSLPKSPVKREVRETLLVRVTCDNRLTKPFRRLPGPKTDRDLALARLEAQKQRPLPKLSPAALGIFR